MPNLAVDVTERSDSSSVLGAFTNLTLDGLHREDTIPLAFLSHATSRDSSRSASIATPIVRDDALHRAPTVLLARTSALTRARATLHTQPHAPSVIPPDRRFYYTRIWAGDGCVTTHHEVAAYAIDAPIGALAACVFVAPLAHSGGMEWECICTSADEHVTLRPRALDTPSVVLRCGQRAPLADMHQITFRERSVVFQLSIV